jgi:RNA polymerase sigma factor (sigma-70 family)
MGSLLIAFRNARYDAPMNTSDEAIQLLRRLPLHDEKALAGLMRLFYSDLYSYAYKFSGDDALVKDCLQEVFIGLWQRREAAAAILSPRYYLLRAVKNNVLKALHHQNKITGLDATGNETSFFTEISIEDLIIRNQLSEEHSRKLHQVINHLPARHKEIIYLKYFQHLDHGQIAALMNISRQSVYNLLYESIIKLKAFWKSEFTY